MDKETLQILERNDKYSARIFYVSCFMALLLFASIINGTIMVNKTCEAMKGAVIEISSIKAEETKEIVRLYFETDYSYPEQTIEQYNEMKVNE